MISHPFILVLLTAALSGAAMSSPKGQQAIIGDAKNGEQSGFHASDREPVPGGSPFYYVDDPGKDILSIVRMYVSPNPPFQGDYDTKVKEMTVTIWGEFTEDVGANARSRLTVSRNGSIWGEPEENLLFESGIDITQPGQEPEYGTKPVDNFLKGPVTMQGKCPSIVPWYQTGNYTLHIEMWKADGSRITDVEATSWVDSREDETDDNPCKQM